MFTLQLYSRPMQNPLFIPEIVHMIFRATDRYSDARSLAMTCRTLFQFIMPQLWKMVVGVEQLLRLIPGTAVSQTDMGNNKKITITISKRALDESWERYWIYSPYVMALRMFTPENVLDIRGWNILSAKQQEAGIPLLPNLKCLDVEQPHTSLDPIHQLALFALFLSPSIRSLGLCIPSSNFKDPSLGTEVLFPSALLLVNSLAKHLPTSHSIPLPPCYDCPTEHMIALPGLSIHKGCADWFERLPVLINLTRLIIQDWAISGGSGEGLIILGHLPHLKYLNIVGVVDASSRHSFFQEEPLNIPSGLFPCLQTLCLRLIPNTQLFYHLWNSETAVSKLNELLISSDHCSVTWDELRTQIIPLLASKSPNLEYVDFLIKVNTDGPNHVSVSGREVLPVLLSCLPISGLTLFGHWQGSIVYSPYIRRAFPFLSCLDVLFPLCHLDLRTFAILLPNLRYLSIYLFPEAFEDVDGIDPKPYKSASLQPMSVHVRYYDYRHFLGPSSNYLEDNRLQITGLFKSIWPNLHRLGICDKPCFHGYREFL